MRHPTENNTPTAQLNSQAVIRLERQSSRWNRRNTASSKSLCLFALITLSFFERYFGKLKREKYCEKKPASQGCTQGRLPRDPCTLGTSEQCAGVIQGRAGLVYSSSSDARKMEKENKCYNKQEKKQEEKV